MAKEVGREETRWDLLQRGAGTHGDFPPTPARLRPGGDDTNTIPASPPSNSPC
jgi:hypothetical protein